MSSEVQENSRESKQEQRQQLPPSSSSALTRSKQRVLVLQGGGALGAYEAGAFRAFYDWLYMQTDDDANIFDVIAGTSIGAINASIIISHVIENARKAKEKGDNKISQKDCWQGAVDKLDEFWLTKINANPVSSYWIHEFWQPEAPFWSSIWPFQKNNKLASTEAARRYFASKESIFFGSRGVFSAVKPIIDTKYFDPFNIWYRSSNQRLRETLEDRVNFPIKTSPHDNEPRLLTITVDVITGHAVTFDSYGKKMLEKGKDLENSRYAWQSTFEEDGMNYYADDNNSNKNGSDDNDNKVPVTIKYEDGLAVEHVLSSASVPINFDYQWIPLTYDYHNISNNYPTNAAASAAAVDIKRFRPFWDGGIMSNTPLKELLQSHRTFWTKEIGDQVLKDNIWEIPRKIKHEPLNQRQDLVPNLDVYMINVWPNQIDGKYLPNDYDLTQARQNNITFGDKTKSDQLTAEIITDYVSLVKRVREEALKNTTTDKEKLDDAFRDILNEFTNPSRMGQSLQLYEKKMDLMLGAFDVEKVLRVERGADKDSIFNMMLDFSEDTIKMMMSRGRHDALLHLIGHSIELVKRFYSKEKEELLSLLEQAQEKIKDNYDELHYNEAISLVKEYVRQRDLYLQRLEVPAEEEELYAAPLKSGEAHSSSVKKKEEGLLEHMPVVTRKRDDDGAESSVLLY